MASKYDHVRKVERRLTVHWKARGRGRERDRRICMWHGEEKAGGGEEGKEGREVSSQMCV